MVLASKRLQGLARRLHRWLHCTLAAPAVRLAFSAFSTSVQTQSLGTLPPSPLRVDTSESRGRSSPVAAKIQEPPARELPKVDACRPPPKAAEDEGR